LLKPHGTLSTLFAMLWPMAVATETERAVAPGNRGNELSKAEAEVYQRQFALIDRNADGRITAGELVKAPSERSRTSEEGGRVLTGEERRGGVLAQELQGDDSDNSTLKAARVEEAGVLDRLPLPPEMVVAGKSLAAHLAHSMRQQVKAFFGQEFGKRDLAFVHVPANFGQSIERVALEGSRESETPFILYGSFNAKTTKDQWDQINGVRGFGGQVWGLMSPDLRVISNFSGCNLVYEPPKYWPSDIASSYFSAGSSRSFGLLRDPFDRLVSQFRQEASGGGKQVVGFKRSDVSEREGSLEREGEMYQNFYSNCDVNGWVKEEMKRYKAGDHFRGNCHLLPQAEYFQHPHGISLPIDTRTIPDSFNVEMERHGYLIRMRTDNIKHNWSCNKLSAWDLDEESKLLIREVYAADFDLLCRHFGYCDTEELTCLAQIPFMCGASTPARSRGAETAS